MTTRRTVLAGAVAVAAAGVVALGAGDDVLRAVGVSPVPEVRASDRALVEAAHRDHLTLLSLATALADPVATAILTEHVDALRTDDASAPMPESAAPTPAQWLAQLEAAAARRRADALAAVAPELVRLFAALSASLSQVAAR